MTEPMTTPEETPEEQQPTTPAGTILLSARMLAFVIGTVALLLVTVILVGLARDQLDPTGVATVLSTLLSGIVVGAILKGRGGSQ